MKKILFLFLLIFITDSFATITCTKKVIKNGPLAPYSCNDFAFRAGIEIPANCRTSNVNYHYFVQNKTSLLEYQYDGLTCPNVPIYPNPTDNGVCNSSDGENVICTNNPDPLGGGQCRDLFQKNGQAYTCNPNTNEATPIPNSDGVETDPEKGDIPKCNEGYEYTSTPHLGGGDKYNDWGCSASSGTGDGGTGSGSGTGDGGSSPTITTNADGSKSWTLPNGTNYNLTTNGTLTTTYPDGSSSVKQVGSDYGAGSSGGGSGTSTGGGAGNTTNENNTTPPTDTPIDNTPVSNSCNDSGLTLQEKMLCELNAGMKKQNSENAPENSLNQLLKDLKTSNQTDNTALNTNLKDIKALNENQLNKQTQSNSTLEKINDSANATELYNKVMNETLNKISNQLEADPNTPDTGNALEGAGNIIDTLANEYTTFKDNMINQGNTIVSLVDSSKETINQGFSFTLSQSDITTCPMDYNLDLSSIGQGSFAVKIDLCKYTSMLKPFLYPLFLISMTLGLVFTSFRLIGVLL
ncbi:putative membrane protein [Arcobacter venerupis]|uniref:Membrane protein n=1 Tax=Arcobacter venerupis TaxID=1054033 RepID=A0AAE7BB64_9BACT|nr:hypothetical protein [Arcobacter venerupis]QKF67174.1 putative membrane protein [Arcobacter venerupis]RWS48386.1 hypothetical protein CKA56_14185 [Arcobacter venerupis]